MWNLLGMYEVLKAPILNLLMSLVKPVAVLLLKYPIIFVMEAQEGPNVLLPLQRSLFSWLKPVTFELAQSPLLYAKLPTVEWWKEIELPV